MTADQVARIERLQAGTMRNCSDLRRSDTRGFIADSLKTIRFLSGKLDEEREASSERIDGLRKALDDRNEMMSAKADERHAAQTENHLLRVAVVRLSCQLSEAAL